jgi:hypothetical protein
MPPRVTVLTAVRNGAKYLPETIASIRAQSFADWEYLLVDDASTDETPRIIDEAARQDSRIKLLRRSKSEGPFIAANQGLREARGYYLVRTDGDDLSLPNRIERQVAFLEARPGLRACAAFCQNLDDNGPIARTIHESPLSSGVIKWYFCLRCALVHSTACMEREALIAIGGYQELPLSQDYRLWCDLSRKGWLEVIPEVLVYFRQHGGRVSQTRTLEQKKLGKDVLRDHITALTHKTWAQNEIEALYAVGHAELFPMTAGVDVINRWDKLWMADKALTGLERNELAGLSAFRRRKFIRSNAKRQPVGFLKHFMAFWFPRPKAL